MPEVFLNRAFPRGSGDDDQKTYLQHLFSPFEEGSKAPAGLVAWDYVTTTALGGTAPKRYQIDPDLALEGQSLYFEEYHGYVRMTFSVIVALVDLEFFVLEWSINNNLYYTTLTPQLDPTYTITQPNQDTLVIDYNLQFHPSIPVFNATRQGNKIIQFTDKEHFRRSLEGIPFAIAVQPRLRPFEPNIIQEPDCYAAIYQKDKDGKIEKVDAVPAPSVENSWLHFISPTQRSSYQVENIRFNLEQWVTLKCTYKLNTAMSEYWPLPFDRTDVDDFSRWSLHTPVLFTQYFEPIAIKEQHTQVQGQQTDSNPAHTSATPVHIATAYHHHPLSLPQPVSILRRSTNKNRFGTSATIASVNRDATGSQQPRDPPRQSQQPQNEFKQQLQPQQQPQMVSLIRFIFISAQFYGAVEEMLNAATLILNTSAFFFKDAGVTKQALGLKTFGREVSNRFLDSDWHFSTDLEATHYVGEGGMGTCIDMPRRRFDSMAGYPPDGPGETIFNTQNLAWGLDAESTCYLLAIPIYVDWSSDQAHLLHLKLRNHEFTPTLEGLLHYHSVSSQRTRLGPRVVDLIPFLYHEPASISGSKPKHLVTPPADGSASISASNPKTNTNIVNDNDAPFTNYASEALPAGAPCVVDGNCLPGHHCVRERCVYSYLQPNFVMDSDFYMLAIFAHKIEHAGLPSLMNAASHTWTPIAPATPSSSSGKVWIFVVLGVLGAVLCIAAFCLYRVARLSNKGLARKEVVLTSMDLGHYDDSDEYESESDDGE